MTKPIKLKSGLYVTATPIGNLGDLSARAKEVLASVDVIACEDKRVSGALLQKFLIKTPMFSYHDHNGEVARPKIIERIKAGESVALISDAGTPLVSDPGYKLVDELRNLDLPVFAVPGPASPMAALMVAGLPSDKFMFMGFLPNKEKARDTALMVVKNIPATLIFLESPRRLDKSLGAMARVLGDERDVAVCRELTKLYEEVRRGTLGQLSQEYAEEPAPKGEVVVVVGPPKQEKAGDQAIEDALRFALETLSVKEAATATAFTMGIPRKKAYKMALDIKNE
ncbi:MAG: 16S rRNA (cytidine(1402)-2'-O)-methyltransferase [Sphingomonadales bacterium]|nr:16S rRNA (cytidine(1402)-2'-O)-methyltransferase [Sphingomonadales bacterium]